MEWRSVQDWDYIVTQPLIFFIILYFFFILSPCVYCPVFALYMRSIVTMWHETDGHAKKKIIVNNVKSSTYDHKEIKSYKGKM